MTELKTKLYEEIGRKIALYRKGKGYSQEMLAGKMGFSRASIANMERGRQHPPIHVLWELAECLEITFTDLIPEKEDLELQPNDKQLEEKVNTILGKEGASTEKLKEFIKTISSKKK